jgi:hypothetical protein
MAITSAYRHRQFDSGLTALHPFQPFAATPMNDRSGEMARII